MSQSISSLSALPVIEAILGASSPLVVARRAADSPDQDENWKALEQRIRAWAPASGEPDVRKEEDGRARYAVAGRIRARRRRLLADGLVAAIRGPYVP